MWQPAFARGVVLLEAVVAIGILSLIVSALLVLASRTNAAMYSATDRVVATYLALDASEWLRGRKLYNEINAVAWDDGITCVSTPCGVNTNNGLDADDLTPCADAAMNDCKLNRTVSLYFHGIVGSPTQVTRTIDVVPRDLDTDLIDDVLEYTITVSWRGSAGLVESAKMYTSIYRDIAP